MAPTDSLIERLTRGSALPASLFLLLCMSVAAVPDGAAAQSVIRGTLLDERTEDVVAEGLVSLLDDRMRIVHSAQTDAQGRFELRTGREGWYVLRTQRQGYMPSTSPRMELIEGDTIDLEYRISAEAVFLAPITVTATRRPWWRDAQPAVLWSFYERMEEYGRLGQGRFLERDDLEIYDGMSMTNMLITIPGLNLSQSETGVPYATTRAATGILRPCQPEYFVDGVRVPFRSPLLEDFDYGDTIDAIVNVSQLVGIEVYTGTSQIPGEFGGLNSNCGVIALWTSRQG